MHHVRYAAQCIGKMQIRWRVIGGIAVEDEQCVDRAGAHGPGKIDEGSPGAGKLFDWRAVVDRFSGIIERAIQHVAKPMQPRRLRSADRDQRGAAIRPQVGDDGIKPARLLCVGRTGDVDRDPQSLRQ